MFVEIYNDLEKVIKIRCPNGNIIDILPPALEILYSHRQATKTATESGGLLIGYENSITYNYTVSSATTPKNKDRRTRFSLWLGKHHKTKVENSESPYGYIGTWHTHPYRIPTPSITDIDDWKQCLIRNHKKTDFLIFIIVGIDQFRVWVGNCYSKDIDEGVIIK